MLVINLDNSNGNQGEDNYPDGGPDRGDQMQDTPLQQPQDQGDLAIYSIASKTIIFSFLLRRQILLQWQGSYSIFKL